MYILSYFVYSNLLVFFSSYMQADIFVTLKACYFVKFKDFFFFEITLF